jgi:hypothetical protein
MRIRIQPFKIMRIRIQIKIEIKFFRYFNKNKVSFTHIYEKSTGIVLDTFYA